MLVIESIFGEILSARLEKKFLSGKKTVVLSASADNLGGNKTALILPPTAALFLQESLGKGEEPAALLQRRLDELNIDQEAIIFFSTRLKKAEDIETRLFILLDKQKLAEIVTQIAKQTQLQIDNVLPEPLVLHRLLKSEIAGEEKRLVLRIGKERSYLYFLNQDGPETVLPEALPTSKLIPVTQKLLKKNPQIANLCSLGIYFGEDSLAFDEKIFAEQTGIELTSAAKIFSARLKKTGILVKEGDNLNKFIAVAAAAVLFNHKETIRIANKEIKAPPGPKQKHNLSVVEKRETVNLRLLVISLGIALIIAGLLLMALRLSNQSLSGPIKVVLPSPTPIASAPSPTLIPTPTVNPAAVKVRILNGSGIAGSAAKLAFRLEEAGFAVVKVDNADSFEYSLTEIHYKQKAQPKAAAVSKILADKQVATPEASLSEDDEADVEIVLGSK